MGQAVKDLHHSESASTVSFLPVTADASHWCKPCTRAGIPAWPLPDMKPGLAVNMRLAPNHTSPSCTAGPLSKTGLTSQSPSPQLRLQVKSASGALPASVTPTAPHTFHTSLIRGDRGTLDSHTVLLGGQRRVDGDLVIGLVTVWKAEVKILELDVHVRQDELGKRARAKCQARRLTWAG